jgi:DNA-binding GntR family transcriptional regulator
MHDLAVRGAAARLDAAQVATMRAANVRFADAVRSGDVDAALAADDALHAVPLMVHGNAAAAATVERYTPLIRRVERRLFSSPAGERSVGLHDQLIDACAAHDVTRAVAINQHIWSALSDTAGIALHHGLLPTA